MPIRTFRAIVLGLGAIMLGVHLVHAWDDALAPLRSDPHIFLAVGRGILNGLTPYVDLFETKPPGIFFLSALSLRMFGDGRLLVLTGALLTALLPLCIVGPLWRRGERRKDVLLAAFLIGAMLSRFTTTLGGGGITESLVVLFAAAAPALWYAYGTTSPLRTTIACGVLFFLCVFLKEPFLLTAIAGMLVVNGKGGDLRRMFGALVIAAVLTLLALLISGYLMPYLEIYMPHMLGFKLSHPWGSANSPIWVRAINIVEIATHLWPFSQIFAVVIGALWIYGGWLLCTLPGGDGLLRWLAATALTTCAVGISGDYYGQHFVFVVPFCAGLAILGIPALRNAFPKSAVPSAIIIALCCVVLLREPLTLAREARWKQGTEKERTAAVAIDWIMQRCDMEKYLPLIGRNHALYGYTKHSPYGPVFVAQRRLLESSQDFLDGFTDAQNEAEIAVMKTEADADFLDPNAWKVIRAVMTETPPPCAGEVPDIEPYRLLFRKTE